MIDPTLRGLAALVLVLTLVCLAFYLSRSLADRNYGGMTCGLRWMIWFAPLWLLGLLAWADEFSQSRLLRSVGVLALFLSAISAAYPAANPWTSPWLYQYWEYLGWLR